MAKYRRQPKAGDLAHKPSAPFAIKPREFAADNFARPMTQARPETDRSNTDISAWRHKITFCKPGAAQNSDIWRIKGRMMGGNAGACKAVTSTPIVARAHIGPRG